MKKFFLPIIAFALIISSCHNSAKSGQNNKDENSTNEISIVELRDFDSVAGNFVGKKIQLAGTVDHVCLHGGQRMFIVDNEAETRVKITPAENVAAFNTEMIGDEMLITGIVEEQRIDEAYLVEWEEEIMAGSNMADDKGEGSHLGGNVEKGGAGAEVSEEMQKVTDLREQIKQSGTDHLSFYSVLCSNFEVVKKGADESAAEESESVTE